MKVILPAILFFIAPVLLFSQPAISFITVTNGLSQSVDAVIEASSGNFYIVERTGKIKIWNNQTLLPTPFLDVSSLIATANGEQGLLSLAFHPDYVNNSYFFIYYTNTSGAITIARYKSTNATTADPSSGVILMTIPKPFANHNGGKLSFGTDGYLYFGTGDGGSAGDPNNNAQTGSSLLGKLLRIDVNNFNTSPYYSIPPTNPYATSTTVRPEIIAMGLRNPWRFSFDRRTNDLWLADVGQDAWEEVNVVPANSRLDRNFGWRCFEGTHVFNSSCSAQPNNVVPVFEYPHNTALGGYSITGGYVYRGSEFPSLQGYYLAADFLSKNGWLISPNTSGGYSASMQRNWPDITSFVEAPNGTLYATSLSGSLYKITVSSALPVRLVTFNGNQTNNSYTLSWKVEFEENGDVYIIERRTNTAELFSEIYKTTVTTDRTQNEYSFNTPITSGNSFYRLKIVSKNGSIRYSAIVSLTNANKQAIKASITGSEIKIMLPQNTTLIQVYDPAGKLILSKIASYGTSHNISLKTAARGIITIRALVDKEWQSIRLMY